jgi:uncharacterized protein YjiS (DUF1127 family)
MRTIALHTAAASPAPSAQPGRLSGFMFRMRERRLARQTHRVLSGLTDRELADIGLNRTMLMNAEALLARSGR